MTKKINKPFFLTKEFWTKSGQQKEIAKAKHTLAGEELEKKLIELDKDLNEEQRQLKVLEVDRKYGKLTDVEYNKQSATIKGEPYVGVLQTHFDPTKPKNGYFELDWNEKFIENLTANGYHGEKEEDAVNKWFNDLCRNIMLEDIDQDVVDELKANIEENKKDLGDGKVEYS